MIVVKTHKATETIRGMDLAVVVKYPEAANIEPLIEKIAQLFAYARKNPDQFGLFDEDESKEK